MSRPHSKRRDHYDSVLHSHVLELLFRLGLDPEKSCITSSYFCVLSVLIHLFLS